MIPKILSLLLLVSLCRADDDIFQGSRTYSQNEIFNIVSEALMKREDVQLLTKNSEAWGMHQVHSMGINEAYAEPIILGLSPLVFNKISTRSFHFHWEPVKNLTLRPDLDYYLDSQRVNLTFTVSWGF